MRGEPRADRAAANGKPAERSTRHLEIALHRRRVPDGRPPRGAAAQRHRPHPPGHRPGSASTPGSTSRSSRTAARTPTCRSTSPPPARGARQLRGAAGRRGPRRHRHSRPLHRRPGAEGRARGAGGRRRLPRPGARRPTGRCSTCSRRSRRARCRSRSSSTCCRRCGPATTPSPPRRWPSPDACSITVGVLRGPARSGSGTFTGTGSGYLASLPENGTVFTFVRSPEHRVPATGEPAHADDHDRGGHRARAVPRLPAGPCRAARPGRAGGPVAAVLRLPQPGGRPALRRRAARLRGARPRAGGERVLPRHRHPVPLRAGRHARLRRRGVGPAPAGRRGLRLRQRLHDRTGRPQRPDPRSSATRPAPGRPTPRPGSRACGRPTGSSRTSGEADGIRRALRRSPVSGPGRRGSLCTYHCTYVTPSRGAG